MLLHHPRILKVAAMLPLLLLLLLAGGSVRAEGWPWRDGSIVFTDSPSKRLLRLDAPNVAPRLIIEGISTYGGLLPWKQGRLLAATKSNKVVHLNPWCNHSCGSTDLVDVPKALGLDKVVDVFALGGMTVCGGDEALYIAYGGNQSTGHSGVLRCAGCELGADCTSRCAVVDGTDSPGAGMHQLGGYATEVECVGDKVLVADNWNFRVQAIPAACPRSPCNVTTFASKLNYPLGIAKVGDNLLVSLDSTIASLDSDGSQHLWSSQDDCGYIVEAGENVLVADRSIVSFDSSCRGPRCESHLVWNATDGIEVYGAVAFVKKV